MSCDLCFKTSVSLCCSQDSVWNSIWYPTDRLAILNQKPGALVCIICRCKLCRSFCSQKNVSFFLGVKKDDFYSFCTRQLALSFQISRLWISFLGRNSRVLKFALQQKAVIANISVSIGKYFLKELKKGSLVSRVLGKYFDGNITDDVSRGIDRCTQTMLFNSLYHGSFLSTVFHLSFLYFTLSPQRRIKVWLWTLCHTVKVAYIDVWG